jgi:uncharacterized protein YggE
VEVDVSRITVPALAITAGVLGAAAAGFAVDAHRSTSPTTAVAPLVPRGRADAVLTADTTPSTPSPAGRTVKVDAEASVSAKPDTMTVQLGVQVNGSSANDTLNQANAKATALIATLKGAGIADADVATNNVSVYPETDMRGHVPGYTASEGVQAILRDLTKAGSVIDAAAHSVGDAITLGGVTFSISDTGPLYVKARQLAVQHAKDEATDLATAAGAGVGQVLSIVDQSVTVPRPYDYPLASAGAATPSTTVPVPIQPGSQEVDLTVEVTFALT